MENYKFILYLDMDGVTTSSNYITKIHNIFIKNQKDINKDFKYRYFMQHWCLQRSAVDCLNMIYDKFPFIIVLTTTRRFELTIPEWNTIFKINDVKASIIGRTNKTITSPWREDEITEHYNKYNFKNTPFIIIDDDSFDLQKYKDKLINVKTETGLTINYYNEIIEKLNNQGVK